MVEPSQVEKSLEERLKEAPAGPGVYIFKDGRGRPLYVGKAKDVRKRLASHLSAAARKTVRGAALVKRSRDVEFIRTNNEKEAILVEDRLVKSLKPRYNVLLRDDKAFLLLRLDTREEYPALALVRRPKRDGALYFGPYVSAASAKETLRLLESAYPLRKCGNKKFKRRKRPCLNNQMGLCLGPCANPVPREEYMKMADEAVLFLRGRTRRLLKNVKKEMQRASEELRFEEAALLRDRLRAIEKGLESQKVVLKTPVDVDVLGASSSGKKAAVALLAVREGALTGSASFMLNAQEAGTKEVLSAFIRQFYGKNPSLIPPRIVVSEPLVDIEDTALFMGEIKGTRVDINCPKRGALKELAGLAETNASARLGEEEKTAASRENLLVELKDVLGLKSAPRRMEALDISHLGGDFAVGAVAAFVNGEPEKAGYRHFRVRGADTRDDYSMLGEVLKRRLRGKEDIPDLIVIDGGKGHLAAAEKVVDELRLAGRVAVAALAKGPERLFLPGSKGPINLGDKKEALHVIMRLRDEAHRFANRYRSILAKKGLLGSALEEIPGIGPRRRKELIKALGSLESIKSATEEELAEVPSMNKRAARQVLEHFKKNP